MDEANKGLLFGALALIFLQIGCKNETGRRIFEEPKSGCLKQVIPNQFLVQWEDGQISLEYGSSKEQFEKEFVEAHLDQIKIVEQDYQIKIPLNIKSELSIQNSSNKQDPLWGVHNINVEEAWDQNVKGSYMNAQGNEEHIIVAVLDDGMDIFHKKLRSQIAYNLGEQGLDENGNNKSSNGKDDDNNGYVDDFAGYNFAQNSNIVNDTSSHGTHVSGIIAAKHDEFSSDVIGVAPAAKILPLDFMSNGGGSISAAVDAIDYAEMMGARIINASWGGSQCSSILEEKINSLSSKNILFVAAAGNESQDIDHQFVYPASFDAPSLIVVGSVEYDFYMGYWIRFFESYYKFKR